MNKGIKAVLVLADGEAFFGYAFGSIRTVKDPVVGEVVFNTSMFGYQEILFDPSYAGQIITFTTPHIGNVGVNSQDVESLKIYAEGMICRELSPIASNYRAEQRLQDLLAYQGVMGLYGIDTRRLVKHIRNKGAQMGAMAVEGKESIPALQEAAIASGSMLGKEYVSYVTCSKPYVWEEGAWMPEKGEYKKIKKDLFNRRPHIVVYDFGVKFNILRELIDVGFRVTVVPANYTFEQVANLLPDALFLSNGPGDPATLEPIVNEVKKFIGKLPIFGICLGHQILAQAFGAKTYKLSFGHRGANHPVKDLRSSKVEITVQNHGFAVDKETLPKGVKVSHLNLNDSTIEGIVNEELKVWSVQYHPESSSGPHDSKYLFKRFFQTVVGA